MTVDEGARSLPSNAGRQQTTLKARTMNDLFAHTDVDDVSHAAG